MRESPTAMMDLLCNIALFSTTKIVALAMFFLAIPPHSGWSSPKSKPIATSVPPLASIVSQIAPDMEVYPLISESSDPHHFEPLPSLLKKAERADIIFFLSHSFEYWGDDLKRIYPQKVFFLEDDSHLGEYASSHDPHLWLDLQGIKLFGKFATKTLCDIYPKRCSQYTSRLINLNSQLTAVRAYCLAKLSFLKARKLFCLHSPLCILVKSCGIDATTLAKHGEENTPSVMVSLYDTAKKTDKFLLLSSAEIGHSDKGGVISGGILSKRPLIPLLKKKIDDISLILGGK